MESSKNGSRKLRIFVRRGALRRFHRLKRDAQDLPVDVEWDRRQEDRREASAVIPTERRQQDRRKDPSFTWDMADFVVAEGEEEK